MITKMDYYNNPDNDGEMMFGFYNLSNETVVIEAGDKLGQGIFQKYYITDDDKTERVRVGGFGSTDDSIMKVINDTISESIKTKYNPIKSFFVGGGI